MVTRDRGLPEPSGTARAVPEMGARPGRGGFTFVEVIVAVVILAFGLLGLAGTTAWVVRTSTMAEAQSKRSVALQSAIERIRAQDFADVSDGSTDIGVFHVVWEVTQSGAESKTLRIVTQGPGMRRGSGGGLPSMSNDVSDTFVYRVLNP